MRWDVVVNIILVVILNYCFAARNGASHSIICEDSTSALACNRNHTLHIVSAMFGRSMVSVCSDNETELCQTPDALYIVTALCEGKRQCRIPATKALFGDSCGNIVSYVEVFYKCQHINNNSVSDFILTNNKEVNLGSSNNLIVAVGILGTLFTVATLTLAMIGIKVWRERINYTRTDLDHNNDLDWSLYGNDHIIQHDQFSSDFHSPIFTGRLSEQTIPDLIFRSDSSS
ncbi:unnamed protein product [Mytilus coruscus]|uniref:SUEL-type lectin domain-containing protein n=1 Tax=Mytilus coruscus TaxID=42192 RepID=A0A6J8ECR9_MYTCO|nr:unnamed protein product [Mytilus coruscus]